jgi:hypothetical protein
VDDSREQLKKTKEASEQDIPIFCAGGCGEVVGYLSEGMTRSQGNNERWCPACKAAASAKGAIPSDKLLRANTDELAELHKPARNLGWLELIRAAMVLVIIAGSILIAMGRPLGIYVAALGTLAWFALCFAVRKLTN